MASQIFHEARAALLTPSTDGDPTAGDPCDSSLDSNVDSREALEKQGDQPKSPDPGLHDNLPPQGPNPEMANEEENDADVAFTSMHWNNEGDTVVLQHRGKDRIFETNSMKSFIRELNLYGFSKIHPPGHSAGKKRMMIYRNSNFQRDKPLLLQNIQRKDNLRTTAQPTTGITCIQEVGKKVKKGTPTAHRTPASTHFWVGQGKPSGSPSGEGTSSNAMSVHPATAGRDGPGELPESPPEYPDYESVMALYNTCYSILTVALSIMAPNKAPEAEKEQGESSDY
ncbi:hypothetical protein FD755_016145, partial [Muntiacus reevesi]